MMFVSQIAPPYSSNSCAVRPWPRFVRVHQIVDQQYDRDDVKETQHGEQQNRERAHEPALAQFGRRKRDQRNEEHGTSAGTTHAGRTSTGLGAHVQRHRGEHSDTGLKAIVHGALVRPHPATALGFGAFLGDMATDFRDGKTFPRRGRDEIDGVMWLRRVSDKGVPPPPARFTITSIPARWTKASWNAGGSRRINSTRPWSGIRPTKPCLRGCAIACLTENIAARKRMAANREDVD